MTSSHSAFEGKIPQNYEKYLGPLIFQEYAEDLSRRVTVTNGGVILETAAGTGLATRQLRTATQKDVRIVVTDLNEDMLHLVRGKFGIHENIEFRTANAMHLPFDDSVFDAVVCQFSIIFFPEKLTSLKEAARVLKPNGVFLFNTWDSFEHNHLVRTVSQSISEQLPESPPDFFNTPYGYYNIDVIKNLLYQVDFGDIEISVLPRISKADTAKNVALGYELGTPVRMQIEKVHQNHSPKL